nr:unnamed protein product [Callosobruchus chinensis]
MRKRYDFEQRESEHDLSLDSNFPTEKSRHSVHSIPVYAGVLVILYLVLLYGLVIYLNGRLPAALDVQDESENPSAFISSRAIHDLQLLTKMGPRITGGYENEVLAVDFITREISFIVQQAHKNQKIEWDVQVVSGAYTLDLLHVDQINAYANVQNVVVKVHGTNDTQNSILVNAHFDSVPTSPGGSDDGINVVAMLEVLRKLSKASARPLHNIILLFNGAEETPLQASHGFITQHKWAKGCKVVLNLEACGAGGKMILFQTGPQTPWLMDYYAKVPHPYAQAAGEEIFQTGWIPSDTDYRVFRDFGGLVGMDFAFYVNGYRYHTKYDDFENIPSGSYQHVGDNLLHLVNSLSRAPELSEDVPTPGKMVFFDFLGFFMVYYTTSIATVMNIAAVLTSTAVAVYGITKLGFTKSSTKYIVTTFLALLSGWIVASVVMLLTAILLDKSGRAMTWYANPWLIFGLYVTPSVFGLTLPLLFTDYQSMALGVRCQIQAHLVRMVWTVVLLVGTFLGIRSMYAVFIPVLFNSLGFVIIYCFRLQYSVRKWQWVYLTSLLIPTLTLMYQTLITFLMFVPLMGRIGSNRNPELIIGMMTLLFTVLLVSPYVALSNLLRNLKHFLIGLTGVYLLCIVIAFTPLGFMYKGDFKDPAAQRYWIMHTTRNFHNFSGNVEKTDSGFFLLNLDRNSPKAVASYVDDISKAKPLAQDCEKFILCGLPLSHAKMVQIMEYSTWIPAGQPLIHEPVVFKMDSKEEIVPDVIRYTITVSGPDRLGVYLVPYENVTMSNMTLMGSSVTTMSGYPYSRNRRLYFVLFTYGKDYSSLTITFDLKGAKLEGPSADFVVTAKYVHDKKIIKTPQYEKFLRGFPAWADLTAWLGAYSAYVI